MKNILYFAPANSVHSFRWAYFLVIHYNVKITWLSFDPVEERYMSDYNLNWDIVELGWHSKLTKSNNKFLALFGLISTARVIKEFYKKSQSEVVHVQSYGRYGISTLFLSKSIPVLGTVWGSDVLFGREGFRGVLLKHALLRAKVVTTDAYHMIDVIKGMNGLINVQELNFGVEDIFFNTSLSKSEVDDRFTILSLRNHYPVYDIESLLSAALFLIKNGTVGFRVIIAGRGDLTEEYHRFVNENKMQDFVSIVGGYNRQKLFDLVSTADLYISTSKSDAGIAASTAEVMALGLPVLISDSGENGRWIDSGSNGFMFETGNARDLAENLLKLMNMSKADLLRIGDNGRETIALRNSLRIEMSKLMNLYTM